jgi:hypothetical protein
MALPPDGLKMLFNDLSVIGAMIRQAFVGGRDRGPGMPIEAPGVLRRRLAGGSSGKDLARSPAWR